MHALLIAKLLHLFPSKTNVLLSLDGGHHGLVLFEVAMHLEDLVHLEGTPRGCCVRRSTLAWLI
jgi:hypothetical protein